MLKFILITTLSLAIIPFPVWADASTPTTSSPESSTPSTQQLIVAYNYAYSLYEAQKFALAKDLFRKLAAASMEAVINGDSLYYYAQCAFRTGDYDGCVKGLELLVKRWPNSPAISKGYVTRFATFLVNEVSGLQTNWDYYRYTDGSVDDKGQLLWKESVPVGYQIKRINFKLGFGLYRILTEIHPNSPEALAAKQKLEIMIDQPIKIIWIDEKAPASKYGHPADFYSSLSKNEKEEFSKVICERIFYNWKTDKLYKFLNVYADVQNLNPEYIANTKPFLETNKNILTTAPLPTFNSHKDNGKLTPPMIAPVTDIVQTYQDPTAVLTLANLFQVADYNPYTDTFTNPVEGTPTEPGM